MNDFFFDSCINAIDNEDIDEIKKLIHSNTNINNNEILYEIYNRNYLYHGRLHFIIEHCTEYIPVSSNLLKILIKDNNVKLLRIIFKKFEYFDIEFIKTLLFYYKNQNPISTTDLNQQISKYRISINLNNINKKYFITEVLNNACANGKEAIVKYLTRLGAKINRGNKNGETPLFFACKSGNENLVRFLIYTGKYRNSTSEKPSFFICKNEKTIKFRINRENRDGETPLFYACQSENENENENIVKFLVELGADIHKGGILHEATPIFNACAYGNGNIVKYLVKLGADVNIKYGYSGDTLLHIFCERGDEKLVKYLIDWGADVNIENRYGVTPLYVSCEKGDEASVYYLVEHGADVNKEDSDGETPIFKACKSGNEKIV
eukprot:jgi/Orpsp1_1/1191696/evm.model.d7180000087892.1